MKLIIKLLLIIFLITFFLISYLTFIGIETDKFNNQISSQVKNINRDLNIELKKIKLVLDPLRLSAKIKTIGPKLVYQNQYIEIENIKAQISLNSFFEDRFLIDNMEISTKSLEINKLISFARSIQNTTQLFVLEKILKKGYLIADLRLEFDNNGKIKENFKVDGLVKDINIDFLKKYEIDKLNFNFEIENKKLLLGDFNFSLNDHNFFSQKILIKSSKDEFFINGEINNEIINLSKDNINLFLKPYFNKLDIEKIIFSSKNIFSFKLNKKNKIENFKIDSDLLIDNLLLNNEYDLKEFFPKIKKEISFIDNKVKLIYNKKELSVNGEGTILFQDQNDSIVYSIKKIKDKLKFKNTLIVKQNPLLINILNYKKNQKVDTIIKIDGELIKDNITLINLFSIEEEKNKIELKKLLINKKLQIDDLDSIKLDYIDKDAQKNLINLKKKENEYLIAGSTFNANNLIQMLLDSDHNQSNIFDIDNKIDINIDKIYLDKENNLKNFSGNLLVKNNEIFEADLKGDFLNNKKLQFKVISNNNEKVTIIYSDNAEPIVKRYKFIKGFNEGSLDFNSSKRNNETSSTLKIYNFKLKELPILTNILTLASLQGIADLLSGEGIRFDELEMNFTNKDNLMTIKEIYAIGPAISILMNGYVEKNKIVSLRGTLVPATTINKAIGSIPLLGEILVGSKTGEGVFGVSFKIKGPPKNLVTTVNPIKTLTPRFITRTLEKIKKN